MVKRENTGIKNFKANKALATLLLTTSLSAISIGCNNKQETSVTTEVATEVTVEPATEVTVEPAITYTAIITETSNAVIMNLESFQKYPDHVNRAGSGTAESLIELTSLEGDKLIVDSTDLKIVEGENSFEKAEILASDLIGDDGIVSYYGELGQKRKIK